MKRNQILKILLYITTAIILISLAHKITIQYFDSKEDEQQDKNVERLIEKGIQFNQIGQIDSSLRICIWHGTLLILFICLRDSLKLPILFQK